MSTTPREKWPQWLREADTRDARVEIVDGRVVWLGGTWCGGYWLGGVWLGGTWRGGVWYDGDWLTGEWRGGIWRGGVWDGGTWHAGTWHAGTWRGGEWRGGRWLTGEWLGGEWHGGEWHGGAWQRGTWNDPHIPDRVAYHASLAGVVVTPDGTRMVAYRSTNADGSGRHTSSFRQTAGRVEIPDASPAGAGTCQPGLHVTSAARAYTYFGIEPAAQLWRCEFTREDLLDCDGEKMRLRGAWCEPVPWPWSVAGAPVVSSSDKEGEEQ